MRLSPPDIRDYTYSVTIAPAELPVSLTKFKSYIKKSGSSEDAVLTQILSAATADAEKFTRRDFIQRTYKTFRDFFPANWQNEGYYAGGVIPSFAQPIRQLTDNVGYEIRKSPLVSVSQIQYSDTSGGTTTVDSGVYYNTVEEDYSEILTNPDKSWPEDLLVKLQAIEITFVAGLSVNQAAFELAHPNLCLAIMQHATNMWANRGDCSNSSCSTSMPATAKATYQRCRIENL